jgi:D-alanine-D-alanine ligase-like ATP-grasp enzyme
MTKTNCSITIGYKAVISVNVKADNEEDAKTIALEIFKASKEKMYRRNDVTLEDDNFKADGCLNMDETWGMM